MAEYTIKKQDDRYEISGLGRLIEHDERSRRYAFDASKVKLALVHHERRVPVLDQGSLGSCFPPGTLVRMSDGSERPIEDVRLLERVLTAEGGSGRYRGPW